MYVKECESAESLAELMRENKRISAWLEKHKHCLLVSSPALRIYISIPTAFLAGDPSG